MSLPAFMIAPFVAAQSHASVTTMRCPMLVSFLCLVVGCGAPPATTIQTVTPPRQESTPALPPPLHSNVSPGLRQLPPDDARVITARYIHQMHQRLHPVYAEAYLDELNALPENHPHNDQSLSTLVAFKIEGKSGDLLALTTIEASEEVEFDEGVIAAIRRATPFQSAPPIIHSPDGNVYIHWEFYRKPGYACATYFARHVPLEFPLEPTSE